MAQEQKARAKAQDTEAEEAAESSASAQAQSVSVATDDLLDEIDGVLEENAEEFVKSYVQKGGE